MEGTQLFPAVPEDLTALGDEQLSELLAELRTVSNALRAGEIDIEERFPDTNRAEASAAVMEQWREAGVAAQAIRDEIASRRAGEEEFAAEAAELAAVFGDDEEETVAEAAAVEETVEPLAAEADEEAAAEEDEDEEEAEEEAVVAAAPTAPRRVLYPAVPRSHQAPTSDEVRSMLVAAAGNPGVRGGEVLDRIGFADALLEVARRRGTPRHHAGGTEEKILVASVDFAFPEEQRLRADQPEENARKIRSVGSPWLGTEGLEALAAAGGICAPPTPFYDLPSFSTTRRPIRDSLASFRADRGGVSVPSVSDLGDITTGVGVIEAADDALGGTFATKSCQTMNCASWTDVFVGAIYHCREYGNFNARTWPEGIAHENDNTMAALARTAEGRLLDRIDSLLINLTGTAVYGAVSSLLYRLQISRAGIISRLRMDPATRFQVVLPFWSAQLFSSDFVNSQGEYRFDYAPEAIASLLGRYGFDVVWHLDEGLAGGADPEVFADESAGAQDDWPSSVVIARLYPAGHLLHLDGGVLELGLVRDSTLNETNDYSVFGEIFENVARIGPEQAGHRLEITLCPDGTVAPDATSALTCSTF